MKIPWKVKVYNVKNREISNIIKLNLKISQYNLFSKFSNKENIMT